MKLSDADIAYIRLDLRRRGLGHDGLLEELTDHICCEVEAAMKGGKSFKQSYEEVLRNVSREQVADLQNNTIQSENHTSLLMLRNTLKIMFRNMRKHRVHSVINVAGLCIGLSCFIVIALYVKHELGYEKMFADSGSIYRVTMSSTVGGQTNFIPTSFPAIGPELKDRYASVKRYARVVNYKYSRLVPAFRHGEKIFYEDNVLFADSTFFELFNFSFISGNPSTALSLPNSVVITARMAEKYFGKGEALGQTLTINGKTELEVTGIIENIPSDTHLQFDFLIPMSMIGASGIFRSVDVLDSWNTDWFWTYLLIPDKNSVPAVSAGINKLAAEKIADFQKDTNAEFYIQSLADIHLHSSFDYNTDLSQNGDIGNLIIFMAAGVLVLLISCINFVNITMATSTRRYKEIGISKVLGAMRSQLRRQFIGESAVTCLFALMLAFALSVWTLPLFSSLLGVPLKIDFMNNWLLITGLVLFTLVIGILSGAYPAFFVSSFEPQRVLKGVWKPGSGGAAFRKALVGIQIAIAVFLIIGTVIISEQLSFIRNKSLGYDKDQIIILPIRGTAVSLRYHQFKNKLLNESTIAGVSSVSEPIGREVQFMSFNIEGRKEVQYVKILNVTHDFVKTMGLEIVKGRDFSHELATDSLSGFVINEAAARAFGWTNPIGKALNLSFRQGHHGHVIGVVKDFNFEPLQKNIDPIIMWFGWPAWYAAVRIQPGQTSLAVEAIERRWKEIEPEKPFAFQFLDQSIQHVYEKEQRLGRVFLVFSVLSILTAVLGLYGLISFVAEQRQAEIGIRKVMGASVKNILYLIAREYVILVVIAFVIAAPVTYLTINKWLENFAFRINWSVWYFTTGFVVSAVIVLATVVSKALGAANANPVNVLNQE